MNSTAYFPNTLANNPESRRAEREESDQSAQTPKQIPGNRESPELMTGMPDRLVENSDENLFEQLGEGNQEALVILFRRYARMVRAIAYRILRDAAEADDLVQEVFLFVFRKWALFDATRGCARSWIVQVTYHRALDRRRHLVSRHFYRSVELEDQVMAATDLRLEVAFYEQSIEGVLGKGILKKIDSMLSEDQRKTIQLYFFEGYTLEEIAALIGQTVGNTRNHYYRGLDKIRKQIFPAKLRVK